MRWRKLNNFCIKIVLKVSAELIVRWHCWQGGSHKKRTVLLPKVSPECVGDFYYNHTNGWPQKSSNTDATALWPMEQSSILSAKFDCSVARQIFFAFNYCAWLWNLLIHGWHSDIIIKASTVIRCLKRAPLSEKSARNAAERNVASCKNSSMTCEYAKWFRV